MTTNQRPGVVWRWEIGEDVGGRIGPTGGELVDGERGDRPGERVVGNIRCGARLLPVFRLLQVRDVLCSDRTWGRDGEAPKDGLQGGPLLGGIAGGDEGIDQCQWGEDEHGGDLGRDATVVNCTVGKPEHDHGGDDTVEDHERIAQASERADRRETRADSRSSASRRSRTCRSTSLACRSEAAEKNAVTVCMMRERSSTWRSAAERLLDTERNGAATRHTSAQSSIGKIVVGRRSPSAMVTTNAVTAPTMGEYDSRSEIAHAVDIADEQIDGALTTQ